MAEADRSEDAPSAVPYELSHCEGSLGYTDCPLCLIVEEGGSSLAKPLEYARFAGLNIESMFIMYYPCFL